MYQKDTIIALATPSGAGAIAVIRLSGPDAIQMVDSVFKSIHTKKLSTQKTHTIHLGHIIDASRPLDEVLVSVFKNPKSYTGEDVIEISCHGSSYINKKLYNCLYVMALVLQIQENLRFVRFWMPNSI